MLASGVQVVFQGVVLGSHEEFGLYRFVVRGLGISAPASRCGLGFLCWVLISALWDPNIGV